VSLIDENKKQRRISVHSDILSNRHTAGVLVNILPLEDFIAADYFLFLHGELFNQGTFIDWRPWSALYVKHSPVFLRSAESSRTADQLASVLKVPNVAEFKRRLIEVTPRLNRLFVGGF